MTNEDLARTINAVINGKSLDTTMRFQDGKIIQRELLSGECFTVNEIDITEDVAKAIGKYLNKEE